MLEEHKRRATYLDIADKSGGVADLVVELAEEDNNTQRTFSADFQSHASVLGQDTNMKKRLKEFSIHHIRQIVTETMKQHNIDHEKWGTRLLDFVQTAVD